MFEIDKSAVLAQFREALEKNDFIVNQEIIADGKFHRLPCIGDKWGNKSGAYKLYLDGYPAGFIQNHKNGDGFNWKYTHSNQIQNYSQKYNPSAIRQKQKDIKKIEQEALLDIEYEKTAARLLSEYENAKNAENHAYLEKKQITANDDIKIDKFGNLLIPLKDENGKFWSVQRITKNGEKFIGAIRTKDEKAQNLEFPARKKGCFYTNKSLKEQDEFIICEGYATAKTLEFELQKSVIMAIDAGNLLSVAKEIHEIYPQKSISIYADNDIAKNNNTNVGLNKALEVKEIIPQVKVFCPVLNKSDMDDKLSDFNDLKCKYGTLKNKISVVSFSKKINENQKESKESEKER